MTVSLQKLKDTVKSKTFRIVLVCLLALALLLICYKVFFGEGKQTSGYIPTAQEVRLQELLCRIEGVKDVTVMITEENGTAVGAVVIFGGTDGLIVRMRLMEIAASALNIEKSAVLVYPA